MGSQSRKQVRFWTLPGRTTSGSASPPARPLPHPRESSTEPRRRAGCCFGRIPTAGQRPSVSERTQRSHHEQVNRRVKGTSGRCYEFWEERPVPAGDDAAADFATAASASAGSLWPTMRTMSPSRTSNTPEVRISAAMWVPRERPRIGVATANLSPTSVKASTSSLEKSSHSAKKRRSPTHSPACPHQTSRSTQVSVFVHSMSGWSSASRSSSRWDGRRRGTAGRVLDWRRSCAPKTARGLRPYTHPAPGYRQMRARNVVGHPGERGRLVLAPEVQCERGARRGARSLAVCSDEC